MNLIETEWHQLKAHEIRGEMFEDTYDLSKLKGHVRAVEARTSEALHEAIADGLSLITLQDVRHWFTYACYCA